MFDILLAAVPAVLVLAGVYVFVRKRSKRRPSDDDPPPPPVPACIDPRTGRVVPCP